MKALTGFFVALCLTLGWVGSAFAKQTGPDPLYVKVKQPADGATVGVDSLIIVEAKASIAADSFVVELVETPGDTHLVWLAGGPDTLKSSEDHTEWTWYYRVRGGDPLKTVRARGKFRYPGNVWSVPKLSAQSFSLMGKMGEKRKATLAERIIGTWRSPEGLIITWKADKTVVIKTPDGQRLVLSYEILSETSWASIMRGHRRIYTNVSIKGDTLTYTNPDGKSISELIRVR